MKKINKLLLFFVFISIILTLCSCEERIMGKTRKEWQEQANSTGIPIALPGETIWPNKKKTKVIENYKSNEADYDESQQKIEKSDNSSNSQNTDDVSTSTSEIRKYECIYCGNSFKKENGKSDECNYMKDTNGNRINTGLNYLLGIVPFCSQKCYDSFHEHPHDGHDVF